MKAHRKDRTSKGRHRPSNSANQYPGIHGKTVDGVDHKFEDGSLYLNVRFMDKTALCWTIESSIAIREAHLSDWKKGNFKRLRVFA